MDRNLLIKLKDGYLELVKNKKLLNILFGTSLALIFFYAIFIAQTSHFPPGKLIEVQKGSGLSAVSEMLKEENLIRSQFWFKVSVVLFGGHRAVKAGDYYFRTPHNTLYIAWHLTRGISGLELIRITIPEGLSVFQIADLLEKRLEFFDTQKFLEIAKEGYLFPDTYFILPNAQAEEVVDIMSENFINRTKDLEAESNKLGRNFDDVITLASIIEEEAVNLNDKKIVSGILLKRIEMKLPLQVDATFSYVNGKNTYSLTKEDLEIDSPYNTYRNLGLPPTPISNPGFDSIYAAIYPTETDYLYFLSDLKGNIYYARDFEEHQTNRELYLRK